MKLLWKLWLNYIFIQRSQEQAPGPAPAAGLKHSDALVEGVFRVMWCTESFAVRDCSDFDVCESWKTSDARITACLCLLETVSMVKQQMERWRIMKGGQTLWGFWTGGAVYRLQRGPWVYRRQRASAGSVYRRCLVYCPLYFDDVWSSPPSKPSHWWL